MTKNHVFHSYHMTGFTLVELVATVVLLSILAVAVGARLVSVGSVSSYTLRDEFISELRKAQLMAMNNTDRCYRVAVTAQGYRIIHYADRLANNSCSGTVERTEPLQAFGGGTFLTLLQNSQNTFNLDFDRDGRTYPPCNGNCIEVEGEEPTLIAIESEGYIHGGR
ncbi:prepilin-type N-terminal cleavage/methylation domain-containing protein [Shewanella sp. NFH-SH190041]|uniref:prepilin-type N-terminal cleavage/methylation domain-containing protein n=1 Tax=Shewanella sp. NFH-SH190041 TaxID=2950245 RepID=UPI0021C448B1|nr:prepilin-type N-terminal cleavage/methylation domain-containing protein [Shewanella sp. NFH-SH190041]